MGRRARRDRRRAPRARRPERGRVLHLGSHLERGRLPVPAARAGVRHEQPARLLQHVPRVERRRARRDDRHRQGHRLDHRHPRGRPAHRGRAEPGHQPPAHAERPREGQGERRHDHRGESAARGRPDPVQEPADAEGHDPRRHEAGRPLRADPPRRRPGAVPGDRQAPAGGGGRRRRRARPRVHRRVHRRLRRPTPRRCARCRGASSSRPPACRRRPCAPWGRPCGTRRRRSSAGRWASRSTSTRCRRCGTSSTCCCCRATSAGRARASARCAATPTCRATARWASTRSRRRRSSSALDREFAFTAPRPHGYDTVEAIRAMRDGRVRVFMGMGGNFVMAAPDTEVTEAALRRTDLTVQVSTKLNRSHVVTGRRAIILPTLGRTDRDRRGGAEQRVSVEDSMGAVHSSRGPPGAAGRGPAQRGRDHRAPAARSSSRGEPDAPRADWAALEADYGRIRGHIAQTIPGFDDYDRRIDKGATLSLPNGPRDERRFATASGRARFTVNRLEYPRIPRGRLLLQTMRSHDQYNTTIYGKDDRYRGIHDGRRVVFVHPRDIQERGLRRRRHRRSRLGVAVGIRRHRGAAGRGVPHRRLPHPAGQRRGVLPRDERARAARLGRGGQRHPDVEVDRHPARTACAIKWVHARFAADRRRDHRLRSVGAGRASGRLRPGRRRRAARGRVRVPRGDDRRRRRRQRDVRAPRGARRRAPGSSSRPGAPGSGRATRHPRARRSSSSGPSRGSPRSCAAPAPRRSRRGCSPAASPGWRDRRLIVNLPGSPAGVASGMPIVLSVARHVIDQLGGRGPPMSGVRLARISAEPARPRRPPARHRRRLGGRGDDVRRARARSRSGCRGRGRRAGVLRAPRRRGGARGDRRRGRSARRRPSSR